MYFTSLSGIFLTLFDRAQSELFGINLAQWDEKRVRHIIHCFKVTCIFHLAKENMSSVCTGNPE